MIRPDGYAKVLDFGLAKLTEPPSSEFVDKEAQTQVRFNTSAGVVMGTLIYMSPEQARGLPLDARTDIFSFGVLTYELVTGRRPFTGVNQNDLLAALFSDKEPVPLAHYSSEVPGELERIVAKALRKERDERYQTVKDLLLDLKSLQQNLEFEKKLERSAQRIASAETNLTGEGQSQRIARLGPFSSHPLILGIFLFFVVGAALFFTWRLMARPGPTQPEIKSLAVLPLKSLDAGENSLGLGIADAVIRRISQTGALTVRPTSAVRRYLTEDTDALTAAKQLNTDAVLEGSVQRADDRLRVSVNLLRVGDGTSLYADRFDMQMTDIFTLQDTVAQQVASRLRLQLDSSQQARLKKQYTSNPTAYEFYVKGVYTFDQRVSAGQTIVPAAIEFFKKAVEADPNFALAHAQLAYADAVMAVFLEPKETKWLEQAKEEINLAQILDPELAETHLARFQLLFSEHEGYQVEAAVREALMAQKLNPSVGHGELAFVFSHIGLEDLADTELHRALDIDPTSRFIKTQILVNDQLGERYDFWLRDQQKLFPNEPLSAWYLLRRGRLEEAQKQIEEGLVNGSTNVTDGGLNLRPKKALLFAIKGDFRSAEDLIPSILKEHPTKDPLYHHAAYDIACVYALKGKSAEAVKWLKDAADNGLQAKALERDTHLDRIRQAPEFIEFMDETKAKWARYREEFSSQTVR